MIFFIVHFEFFISFCRISCGRVNQTQSHVHPIGPTDFPNAHFNNKRFSSLINRGQNVLNCFFQQNSEHHSNNFFLHQRCHNQRSLQEKFKSDKRLVEISANRTERQKLSRFKPAALGPEKLLSLVFAGLLVCHLYLRNNLGKLFRSRTF